jgi:hypothetical protein
MCNTPPPNVCVCALQWNDNAPKASEVSCGKDVCVQLLHSMVLANYCKKLNFNDKNVQFHIGS